MFKKLIVCYFIFLFSASLFFIAVPAYAADMSFTPQVAIPGYTADFTSKSTKPIGEYVQAIYKYAIGIVGIIATVVLMFGGVLWLTAGGDSGKIGEAQSWITASITGLLLAIGSYLILATVNPDLVNLKVSSIPTVQPATNTDATTKATNPCCTWTHATAASLLCGVTPSCIGPLYENCDDTNANLTQADCYSKPGLTNYISIGKCSKRTLIGTSNTFTAYACSAN